MRYHLETIPVWDAMKAGGECPLCDIRRSLDEQKVAGMLGGALMEPSQRVETNRLGFCPHHLERMYAEKNRLGLALMMHTHLGETAAAHREAFKSLTAAVEGEAKGSVLKRAVAAAGHGGASAQAAREAVKKLLKRTKTCYLCESIDSHMRRYLATIAYMWKTEKEFAEALANGKGFCHPHAGELLGIAADELSGADLRGFLQTIIAVQERKNERLLAELEWFTLKFDYRNQDKPWGESKDALPRAINMARGHAIDSES